MGSLLDDLQPDVPDAWTEDPVIRGCSQGRQVETGAAQEAAALRGLGTVAFRMAGE